MAFNLYNRNGGPALKQWMYDALNKSDLTKEEYELLAREGLLVIEDGGWRGNVCDRWRSLGFNSAKIHDFYP
jgi:hypothetical protein